MMSAVAVISRPQEQIRIVHFQDVFIRDGLPMSWMIRNWRELSGIEGPVRPCGNREGGLLAFLYATHIGLVNIDVKFHFRQIRSQSKTTSAPSWLRQQSVPVPRYV